MKYASIIKTFGIGHNDCHHHFNGCASGPPAKLLERHDHAALARWYEQEAATLRQRAEEMRTMVQEVRDYDAKRFYVDKVP